ncbi:MAG: pitrilysin family protein [Candidatus Eisenbacteria bacterium]
MRQSRQLRRTAALAALVLFVTAPLSLADEAHRTRLSNGVTVITNSSSWNRIVAIAVVVEAGGKYDPPKLGGLAALTSELLVEGTQDRSAMELAELIDMHGLNIETFANVDFAGFYVLCIEDNFDVALEVAAEILTRPSFQETRLLRAQERALSRIENDNENSVDRNHEQLYEVLFEGHPYSRPVAGLPKTIERITRDHVNEFYTTRYLSESTSVSIVGSFSEKQAIAALEDLLSDYPRGRATKPAMAAVRRTEREADDIYMDAPESRLSVGYLMPSAPHKDYAALRVLTTMLGGGAGTRLHDALGDDGAGLASDVDAFCFCAVEQSAIVVTLATPDPDAAMGIIEAETARLRAEPVSDDELRIARNKLTGSVAVRSQTNLTRALRLSIDYLATGRVDALDTYLEQVSRVSRDDVLRVAREHLVGRVAAVVRPGRSARSERGTSRTGI